MKDTMTKKRKEELNHFIRRLETIGEEIGELKASEKEIFTEAKAAGWNVKAFREILKRRRMDDQSRMNLETDIELYNEALGWSGTPLGDAAADAEDADAGDDEEDDPPPAFH